MRTTRLAALAGAALAVVLATVGVPAAAQPPAPRAFAHPVFVQNDDPAGNTVIAYDRTPSGALVQAGAYPTGGKGGVLDGSVVDHLASQGSLAYDGGLLFAVNAGSDTVTTFAVHGDRLVRRQVVPSGGDFPVSVTARGSLVYVLNARGGGSIQGYLRVGSGLVRIPSWHRALGLDPDQTPEFTSTPGQIGFTPGGRQLVVTTKNGGNSVVVYPVGRFGPGAPRVNPLPGAVPFGFAFDARGHLALTEAGPNAVATFVVRPSGALLPLDSVPTGQAATCWAVAAGSDVYAANAGSGTLSGYRVGIGGALRPLAVTPTGAGTVDAAVSRDGRFLYVQTGVAGGVDAFRIGRDGTLVGVGSVIVPNAVGGEGIVAL